MTYEVFVFFYFDTNHAFSLVHSVRAIRRVKPGYINMVT